MMLKQQKLTELLNNSILIIDTIKNTAKNGFDDGYYNADKSFKKIVRFCDKLFIFVDNIRQCYSPDKSPDLNNLQ